MLAVLLVTISLKGLIPVAIPFPSMASCEANRERVIAGYKEIIGAFPPVPVKGKCVELDG